VKKNISLSKLTTLGIGGKAKYFIEVETEKEAIEAIRFARTQRLPTFILGGGSNILISDGGFPGLVIHNKISYIHTSKKRDKVTLKVGSGEIWDDLVTYSVRRNLQGIECLAGIPGTVGAAPVQNIGAYGQEVSDTIKGVRAIDLQTGVISYFTNEQCLFSYRQSLFNTTHKDRYMVLEVEFELRPDTQPIIKYRDLLDLFAGQAAPTLKDVREAVIKKRAEKGMVISKDFESYRSAGSFFKNPIINDDEMNDLKKKIDDSNGKWYWEMPEGKVKVSAAKLIESAGFEKGYILKSVGISPKHSLSIINLGGAEAKDIIELKEKITEAVKKKFSIDLQMEVQLVGFPETI
jgi:UDP-N-acetylmuramate dehydrogenase